MAYNPEPETANILNWMLEKVHSVPYSVTLRWAFYQCVQELGLQKSDYGRIKSYAATARKNFWNGWSPTTLEDDTRKIYYNGSGFKDFNRWLNYIRERKPVYRAYDDQETIVQIWFEAQAMYSQFEHYAAPYRIDLVPFKGDTSINLKWKIAEHLADLFELYRKPIIILYFGDYEPFHDRGSRGKGITIPLNALKDIKAWFATVLLSKKVITIEEYKAGVIEHALIYLRVGLNQEHIDNWHLPENPERPGEYQWEALGDEQARELIIGSIESYWDVLKIRELEERERRDTDHWRGIIDKAIDEFTEEQDGGGDEEE